MAPLLLLFIPNGDFDLSSIFAHVDCGGKLELDLYTNVSGNMSRRIRIRNVSKTLFNCENWAHSPFSSLFALLWVLVHLEVNNSTDNEVILDLVWRQVVIAGPKSSHDNLTTGLLLG